MPLLTHTKKGLFCDQAGVYIDPTTRVDNALITHGHSDHARPGHKYYVCSTPSVCILKHRLGSNINIKGLDYGEYLTVNGVQFSFHPAGHIIGSAQIRVEYKGEIWVVSGDYKIEDDGLCQPYEVVKCHHFITECTFGLPIYQWRPQEEVITDIKQWWSNNASQGRPSVITAYSLGKAQRIIHSVGEDMGPIYVHRSIQQMNEVITSSGVRLPSTKPMTPKVIPRELRKALIVVPGSSLRRSENALPKDYSLGIASGWMARKGTRKSRGADKGFVLSDHCDWSGLNKAIQASEASHIYPTHGNTNIFSRWLREQGYRARPLESIDDQYD